MPLRDGRLSGSQAKSSFVAVPFRREPRGSLTQYSDYSMDQIVTGEFRSDLWSPDWARSIQPTVSSSFAAEGWIWSHEGSGLVISKYSQAGLEFAILDRVPLSEGKVGLRWGGIGIWLGSPDQGAGFCPGEAIILVLPGLRTSTEKWNKAITRFDANESRGAMAARQTSIRRFIGMNSMTTNFLRSPTANLMIQRCVGVTTPSTI